MEDKAFRTSNIEVVKEGHFVPDINTVPINKDVLQHPNADVYFDKAQDKIILVPEQQGFGVKSYEQGDLSDKLSKKVDQTKADVYQWGVETAQKTAAGVEKAADKVKDKAAEAKHEMQTKSIPTESLTDKLATMQKNFTVKVASLAENMLGIHPKTEVEDKVSKKAHEVADKAHDVADKAQHTANKVQDKATGILDTIVDKAEQFKHDVSEKISDLTEGKHLTKVTDITEPVMTAQQKSFLAAMADDNWTAGPFSDLTVGKVTDITKPVMTEEQQKRFFVAMADDNWTANPADLL